MRRGARSVLILLAAMALLLAVPAAAPAKKHKKQKSPPVSVTSATQSTTTAGDVIVVIATCPRGFAVGGGFSSHPTFTGGGVFGVYFVFESRPITQRSWKVAAIREDTTGPAPLTSFVDCRSGKLPPPKKKTKKKRKLKILEATANATAADNSEGSATAICPPGTQALTGGFSTSPNPDVGSGALPLIAKSYRSAPGAWTSAFLNIGSTTRSLISYVYCASGLTITDTVGTAALPGSSGSAIGSGTAVSTPCPPRRALLGGGFNNPVASSTNPVAIINTAQPVGGSFEVSALNDSSQPGTLESHGYCA